MPRWGVVLATFVHTVNIMMPLCVYCFSGRRYNLRSVSLGMLAFVGVLIRGASHSLIFRPIVPADDQTLYEDNLVNRLVEALNLFEVGLSHSWCH